MMITSPSGICDQVIGNRKQNRDHGHLIYTLLWWFIIVVSAIDGYLMFEYQACVRELNPVGQWLIELNGGRVWYLLTTKFAGTVAACSILEITFSIDRRTGIVAVVAVGLFQGCLLLFLFLA